MQRVSPRMGRGHGSGSDVSDGEPQMELGLLPATPLMTDCGPAPIHGPGTGDPCPTSRPGARPGGVTVLEP